MRTNLHKNDTFFVFFFSVSCCIFCFGLVRYWTKISFFLYSFGQQEQVLKTMNTKNIELKLHQYYISSFYFDQIWSLQFIAYLFHLLGSSVNQGKVEIALFRIHNYFFSYKIGFFNFSFFAISLTNFAFHIFFSFYQCHFREKKKCIIFKLERKVLKRMRITLIT